MLWPFLTPKLETASTENIVKPKNPKFEDTTADFMPISMFEVWIRDCLVACFVRPRYQNFDPYAILEVGGTSSNSQIKSLRCTTAIQCRASSVWIVSSGFRKAFHKLSLKYHPDKNPDAAAAEKFMLIKKAQRLQIPWAGPRKMCSNQSSSYLTRRLYQRSLPTSLTVLTNDSCLTVGLFGCLAAQRHMTRWQTQWPSAITVGNWEFWTFPFWRVVLRLGKE